jgi:hypothetical protein
MTKISGSNRTPPPEIKHDDHRVVLSPSGGLGSRVVSRAPPQKQVVPPPQPPAGKRSPLNLQSSARPTFPLSIAERAAKLSAAMARPALPALKAEFNLEEFGKALDANADAHAPAAAKRPLDLTEPAFNSGAAFRRMNRKDAGDASPVFRSQAVADVSPFLKAQYAGEAYEKDLKDVVDSGQCRNVTRLVRLKEKVDEWYDACTYLLSLDERDAAQPHRAGVNTALDNAIREIHLPTTPAGPNRGLTASWLKARMEDSGVRNGSLFHTPKDRKTRDYSEVLRALDAYSKIEASFSSKSVIQDLDVAPLKTALARVYDEADAYIRRYDNHAHTSVMVELKSRARKEAENIDALLELAAEARNGSDLHKLETNHDGLGRLDVRRALLQLRTGWLAPPK